MLLCQSGPCCLPSWDPFGCTIQVSVSRILCACCRMPCGRGFLILAQAPSSSQNSAGIQSHSLIPSDLSLNLEISTTSAIHSGAWFLFFPYFSWKSCTVAVPHVDLVKYVVELPHILLSLCTYKALLFPVPDPALDSRVGALPFHLLSPLKCPHLSITVSLTCLRVKGCSSSQQGSGCDPGVSAGWGRAQVS